MPNKKSAGRGKNKRKGGKYSRAPAHDSLGSTEMSLGLPRTQDEDADTKQKTACESPGVGPPGDHNLYDSVERRPLEGGPIASSTPMSAGAEAGLKPNPFGIESLDSILGASFSSLELEPQTYEEATEATHLIQGGDLENGYGDGAVTDGPRDPVLFSILQTIRWILQNRRMWMAMLYILALALFMLVLVFLVDFKKLASEAFLTDILSVAVLGINDSGVAVHVTGTLETNYSGVSNPLLRYVAKTGALLIGGITVIPRDQCRIYVRTDHVDETHLLDIFPPELTVDLIDHRVSEVDFISDAVVVSDGTARVLEALVSHNLSAPLLLDVEIRLAPRIRGKWFSVQLGLASVSQTIKISTHQLGFPLEVHELSVSDNDGITNISFASSLNPVPMEFQLSQIEWDLAIADCNAAPIVVGEWSTSSMSFDPGSVSNFTVSGSLNEIPDSLLEVCSDGFSPINRFVRLIVNDKIIAGILSARRSGRNEDDLPAWLYSTLTRMSVHYSIPTPHMGRNPGNTSKLDFLLDSSKFVVETMRDKRLVVRLDTKTEIEIDSPSSQISFSGAANNIRSKLLLSQFGANFLEAHISDSGNARLSSLSSNPNVVSIDCSNISAWLTDPRLAGRFFQSILLEQELKLPEWSIDVEEVTLELHSLSTVLKDLRLKSTPNSTGALDSLREKNASFVDWILREAQILTDRIFCVSSSAKHAEFLVDFQITNPLNASVVVLNDILRFDLKYNETTVAVVLLENMLIPKSRDRVMLTASMTIFYTTNAQRVMLEEFVSHVISGSEKTRFAIAGSRTSLDVGDTDLSRLLQEIEIRDILLPELNFTQSGTLEENLKASGFQYTSNTALDLKEDDKRGRQSPFLVDATFHLWTSEMELTVFNPISNVELEVRIISCLASYKGEILAHVEWSELLSIPPGVHATPRFPIKIASGIGADTLRKALNGNLAVDVVAELSVNVDKFPTELMYRGTGLTAKVRI